MQPSFLCLAFSFEADPLGLELGVLRIAKFDPAPVFVAEHVSIVTRLWLLKASRRVFRRHAEQTKIPSAVAPRDGSCSREAQLRLSRSVLLLARSANRSARPATP